MREGAETESPAEAMALAVGVALRRAALRHIGFWVACCAGRTFCERVEALLHIFTSAPFDLVVARDAWSPFGSDCGVFIPDSSRACEDMVELTRAMFREPTRYFRAAEMRLDRAVLLRDFLANDVLEANFSRPVAAQWLSVEVLAAANVVATTVSNGQGLLADVRYILDHAR